MSMRFSESARHNYRSFRMRTVLVFLAFWMLPIWLSAAPVLLTATVKGRTKIECSHELPNADIITWTKDSRQIAYKDSERTNIDPRYTIEEKGRTVYLVISDVHKEDAGTYTCAVFFTKGARSYKTSESQLEVIDSGSMLQCSFTVILLGCLLLAVLP
ncbi:hypothetical protein MATL_G00231340 [Megalops atlanticus]|uniref:Ig-like domain-containing protein n=1 Tax=Megalops atlanticus TaxID=7932 RepID=A0A9D3SY29_MEGAT|nr:hypothetical protein MATL_G00231340 [Megalops atlanticus]